MKNLRNWIWALALLLASPFAMGQEVKSKAYGLMLSALLSRDVPEVGVADAAAMEGALFLDTREWKEFEVSHIQDARWAGFDTFQLDRLDGIPTDRPIIVYCSVGYRSEKITRRLRKEGFSRVYNLYGGLFEWVNRGNPVFDAQGSTEKVHAYDAFWGRWLKRGQKVY